MRLVLLLPILLSAGCATPPSVPLEVRVPVALACQPPAIEVPRFATSDLRPDDDLQTKIRALLAERQQHLAYEVRLRAALDACR
ncbi:hypothetical protein NK553_03980 [Pseudomonas sp. ZM23]|uniref:Lipoprotein n=1 Tax=Pseudomonas triclosanedens TaxID=2961893 RepID=A0ABY7A233_9PSED|nr:hypothetical protein [Pseudomonas triclosanedens]MCP8463101.1 hypothetical protein [Pseudomonas triclosanedens]MCP8468721.1 hypothetical protein [Pseudomonas triclosanedens]MCP8475443.1 hypothetical protein [Pseudomonas triclosanedens]WAI50275.1 hypothetical protein OU419_03100 [Pseudomonas triclosanedens]